MLAQAPVGLYAIAWLVWFGMSTGVSLVLAAQGSTGSTSSAAPLMTAGFTMPHTSVDLQSLHLLRACQSTFERTMRLAVAENDRSLRDSVFSPIPPAAVTAGRACLSRIGDTRSLAGLDLPLLLRFAIGVNDDRLVQQVVLRQFALAGPSVRERGHVLETAIAAVLHNHWSTTAHVYRTAAHDTLALRYVAVLDTMHPAGQVLLSRLHIMDTLDAAFAPVEWNVDAQLVRQRTQLQVATSVPLRAVPPEDTAEVHAKQSPLAVAWTTYLKTPTHANLAHWIAVRDSILDLPRGQTVDSLLNHPAPRLAADYWFNLPQGTTAPVISARGVVSLILFGNDLSAVDAAQLRKLQSTYPALQIVLVAMTHGEFDGQSLRGQPAREAALIHHHLTDELQLPGIVGVLQTQYHTAPNLKDIPIASPGLDRFHLDPRAYAGHMFVVDAQGVLVNNGSRSILDGRLIQRLLIH